MYFDNDFIWWISRRLLAIYFQLNFFLKSHQNHLVMNGLIFVLSANSCSSNQPLDVVTSQFTAITHLTYFHVSCNTLQQFIWNSWYRPSCFWALTYYPRIDRCV
jgi:hypothetical protein